jgi:signal peptidase I
VAVLLILAIALRVNLRQGRVTGASMEPTYSNGETVLVWKTYPMSLLKPGDVIVFRDRNDDELIKRVAFIRAWMPQPPQGDYANPNGGRLIPYTVLFGDYFAWVASGKTPRPAPENTIYVLGDNLLVSDDSRHFGPIAPGQILGKVVP